MKVGFAMLSLLATEHQRCNIHDIGASRNLTLAVTGSRSLPVRSWKPWLVTINWLELSLYSDQRNWMCSGQEKQTRVDKPNLAGANCQQLALGHRSDAKC